MAPYTLDEIRAFQAVATAGGFTSAAQRLGVSTNAISLRVQRLERALGVRLLVRTTRSLALTEEGRLFAERSASAMADLEAVESELRPSKDGLRGNVRIALPGVVATGVFLARVSELLREHPLLALQLRVANAPINAIAEGVDIQVVVGQPPDSTFVGRHLGRATWVLAASPAYLDRMGRPSSPADLAAHQCLRLLGTTPQREWSLVDVHGHEVTVPVGGSFEADDSRALGDAAYEGLGVGVRPLGECVAAARTGLLERVLPDYSFQPLDVYALLPPGRLQLRRVEVCVEALGASVAALA